MKAETMTSLLKAELAKLDGAVQMTMQKNGQSTEKSRDSLSEVNETVRSASLSENKIQSLGAVR